MFKLTRILLRSHRKQLNPYSPNVTFLYRRFSDVFRGYRNKTMGKYGLMEFPQIVTLISDQDPKAITCRRLFSAL